MLDALQPGDAVVVTRLDRLSRDSALAVHLEYEIERVREARLVSLAGEGTSPDGPPDPTAIFLRRVLAAQAELQAAQASSSTRAALAVKRAEGRSTNGTAAYGHRVDADGRVVPDDQEQAVLAAVLEFTRGRLWNASPQEVADYLNSRGFRNRAGRPFGRTVALRIIKRLSQETAAV
jgi:DNA invertase Pin-like site-specific DNA recombinase